MFCYIHIPFCKSKCKYCRFASTKEDKLKIKSYIEKLKKDIASFSLKNEKLDSIYFGGGTPSILDISELNEIISSLEKKFGFKNNIEITLETTPQNITKNNIVGWKNLGINRLSIGIQTLNDNSLREIGRESKETILKALNEIKNNKFENISLDFIIGLPFTVKGETKKDIEFILEKYDFIKHISVYMLEDYHYDFDTSLKDSEYLEEYNEVRKYLEKNGFNFYELSNSAKTGYECKHNKAYWNHSEIIAFGLASHFFVNGIRYENSSNFKGFYNGDITEEKLSKNDIFLEKIMFGIRTNGIDKSFLKKLNKNKIDNFIKDGFLKIKDNKIILTEKSYTLVDFIIKEII